MFTIIIGARTESQLRRSQRGGLDADAVPGCQAGCFEAALPVVSSVAAGSHARGTEPLALPRLQDTGSTDPMICSS